ncbi:hypothetical protein [Candidatus Contendibacter odensensis]|uniref:FixH family protein n=1 Tax=Candidatus Contendobacter odensis Run_B_J11 TaxID=1400861 RepID=A0A7U7G820_9GAMM|nr:hypothetical protein [Candidatus Contendobacter odensis]CDH43210.1 hypothetical protein BN874_110012 [Candidatus Contendobacter odensis Run_B_J11]
MEHKITKNDLLIFSATAAILFVLGILSSMYYPHLSDWLQHRSEQTVILNADRACNPINKTCTISDSELAIALKLGDSVQPLAAFPVLVSLAGTTAAKAKAVTVYFTMADMDMGFNRFDLGQQADGTWRGQAILPVCTAGRRDWRATVKVASDPPYTGEFYLLANP